METPSSVLNPFPTLGLGTVVQEPQLEPGPIGNSIVVAWQAVASSATEARAAHTANRAPRRLLPASGDGCTDPIYRPSAAVAYPRDG
jgi:hypothetical protein